MYIILLCSYNNIIGKWVGSGVCKWAGWGSLWCVGMGGVLGAEMVT